ncbi:replication protein A 70 kDa DNA-binding subunit B [Tanacetum coccineum]
MAASMSVTSVSQFYFPRCDADFQGVEHAQKEHKGINEVYQRVTSINRRKNGVKVTVENETSFFADAAVIAMPLGERRYYRNEDQEKEKLRNIFPLIALLEQNPDTYKGTTVTRVGSFDNNPHGFKFEHFSSLTARTFTETKLCDVIGTVVSVSDATLFNNYGKDQLRRTIILEDVYGAQLECCFFDAWCNKFTKLYDERESMGHVVMILQLCKVKYFNAKPSVSPAMYSTKLYLNDDIQEIAAFRQRYSEKEGFDPANHTIAVYTPVKKEITADDFFKGAIKKTVGSIRDSDGPYHCLLYAKIHKIHRENGWTYLACKKCGRSAKEADSDESSYSGKRTTTNKFWNCRIHKGLTASLVHMRFKVVVRVMDDTGSASLLLFDDLVFNLTNGEQCHKLIQEHGPNYDDYFPPELNVLVGKRVLWRFQYTNDHIENNNFLYQVKLLSVDEAMVTRFKKDFILEENIVNRLNTVSIKVKSVSSS